jgi:hypothetical protein
MNIILKMVIAIAKVALAVAARAAFVEVVELLGML